MNNPWLWVLCNMFNDTSGVFIIWVGLIEKGTNISNLKEVVLSCINGETT